MRINGNRLTAGDFTIKGSTFIYIDSRVSALMNDTLTFIPFETEDSSIYLINKFKFFATHLAAAVKNHPIILIRIKVTMGHSYRMFLFLDDMFQKINSYSSRLVSSMR